MEARGVFVHAQGFGTLHATGGLTEGARVNRSVTHPAQPAKLLFERLGKDVSPPPYARSATLSVADPFQSGSGARPARLEEQVGAPVARHGRCKQIAKMRRFTLIQLWSDMIANGVLPSLFVKLHIEGGQQVVSGSRIKTLATYRKSG